MANQDSIEIIFEYDNEEFRLALSLGDDADLLCDMIAGQVFSLSDIAPENQKVEPALRPTVRRAVDQIRLNPSSSLEPLRFRLKSNSSPPRDAEASATLNEEDSFLMQQLDWENSCTRVYLGDTVSLQPSMMADNVRVCIGCAQTCIESSHLSVGSFNPTPFVCGCGVDSSDNQASSCLFSTRLQPSFEKLSEPFSSKFRTILREALYSQHRASMEAGMRSMTRRIGTYLAQSRDFEDGENQTKARMAIPLQDLERRASEAAKLAGRETFSRDDLLRALLHWFKAEFFRWVNEAACNACGGSTTGIGVTHADESEKRFHASQVELYRCKAEQCGSITRFPRYNHSGKLIETRQGRCGEWAQAFTLCCRALGFEARFVVDWTDHVWTEVYSDTLKQFVHCDPCENSFNSPLMYEQGWGKKLSYVLSFSSKEVRDVSRRYTKDYESMLGRRSECPEEWLELLVERVNAQISSSLTANEKQRVHERWQNELRQINGGLSAADGSTLGGRQTGSLEWRRQRGELGVQVEENSSIDDAADAGARDKNNKQRTREELIELTKAYFAQLTQGCSRDNCSNIQFCASASGFKALTKAGALKQSLQIIKDEGDSKLCGPSTK